MTGEIIEEYPNDYPYPSCLTLGNLNTKWPLHVVVGSNHEQMCIRDRFPYAHAYSVIEPSVDIIYVAVSYTHLDVYTRQDPDLSTGLHSAPHDLLLPAHQYVYQLLHIQ